MSYQNFIIFKLKYNYIIPSFSFLSLTPLLTPRFLSSLLLLHTHTHTTHDISTIDQIHLVLLVCI